MKKNRSNHQGSRDLPIYNCHIHTFTRKNTPRYFLKLVLLPLFSRFNLPIFGRLLTHTIGALLSRLFAWRPMAELLVWLLKGGLLKTRLLIWLLNLDDDVFQRYAAFIQTSNTDSQNEILEGIQRQYPADTTFIVLPMDMKYMELGELDETLEEQHRDLLAIAAGSDGHVIPFYAADPRRPDLIEQIQENLAPDKFRGVKIYPNLGYHPYDPKLMQVYAICEQRGYPVMAHCNKGGIYKYGLTKDDRTELGSPNNYLRILERYPSLRLCLAHFGGNDEWDRQLTSLTDLNSEPTWVSLIADMIRSGLYPNLYTDISYTIFTLKPRGLYVDHFDYLKVLLNNQRIQEHVLFGSDYYMVEQEPITEKQISLALRSRLGEELYFQIAHYNPRKYLGTDESEAVPYA